MKSLFSIAVAAVLIFVSVIPSVHANPTVQTKSIKVATDPICCCATLNILNHKIHLKTKKIKARISVLA